MLPASVRRFLQRRVDNVEQLEIVLLLHQHPARSWTAADVADALRLAEREAARHLEALGGRGLLDVRLGDDVRYRFSPSAPDLEPAVRQLSECYRDRRSDVVSFVLSGRRSLRDFSDAFRLTKDNDG